MGPIHNTVDGQITGLGLNFSGNFVHECLLGGIVQILCIGIIGEYLGKIYMEVKSRPWFTIETMISSNN